MVVINLTNESSERPLISEKPTKNSKEFPKKSGIHYFQTCM